MRRAPILPVVLLLALPTAVPADDWLQFRGPGGQGQATATGLPVTWSESQNIAWKVPIDGRGWSSPVVLGDQVWLTTALDTAASPDEARLALEQIGMPVPSPEVAGHLTLKAICLDRATGRVLRDLVLFETDEPTIMCSVNSFASPTPVAEEGRVYCEFGALGTACLDAANGEVLWSRRLVIEHQVGPGSSPVLYRDLLILVRDGCDEQYVIALDKRTGKTVWKTDRPTLSTPITPFRKAFSTPTFTTVDGNDRMIVPGAQWIVGYDPAGGSELWRVDTGATFSNTSRPVCGHGMTYVSTAYGGSRLLAIRLGGQGDVTDSHVAWELTRQTPKRSSPLLVGDELYLVSDGGVATCADARTGEIHWDERLSGPHSASPAVADGRLYFFGEDGTTTVLRPGRQFDKLAENELDGRIMATPAMVEGAIFLRTDGHVYRIQE